MPHGPTNFHTTVIKPYHQDKTTEISQIAPPAITNNNSRSDYNPTTNITAPLAPTKRREYLKGSKNKPKTTVKAFLTTKKEYNYKLSLTL